MILRLGVVTHLARVHIVLYSSSTMAEELAAIEGALDMGGEPKAKRTKLKPYDLLPAQMLNSMGGSGVETIDLAKLALLQATGNKEAEYYTELCGELASRKGITLSRMKGAMAAQYYTEICNELASRKGIALSRMSEVQLKAGTKLSAQVYKKHISTALYTAAMQEFDGLKPHFTMLMGKDIVMGDGGDTVGSIVYSGVGDFRNLEEVNNAAKTIYVWLKKPTSEWRSLLVLLSGGGLFYSAAVHEKSHRAYIAHGEKDPVPETDYQKWCRARLCSSGPAAVTGDLDGL